MFETFTMTQILSIFMGLYLLSVGASLVLERDKIQTMMQQFSDNSALGFLSGIVAFTVGAALVGLHQDFSNAHAIFISVLGWFVLAKGIFIIIFKEMFMRTASRVFMSPKVSAIIGVIGILVGLWALSVI